MVEAHKDRLRREGRVSEEAPPVQVSVDYEILEKLRANILGFEPLESDQFNGAV